MPDLALAVYDNFLSPEAAQMLRRFAVQQTYGVEEHDGIPYAGVGKDPGLIGPEKLAATLGLPAVKIAASFFRFGPPVADTNSYIHVDNGMYGSHAAVLYLRDPPLPGGYGTAFWTHKERGWAYMPNVDALQRAGLIPEPPPWDWECPATREHAKEVTSFYASLNEDGLHEDRWHLNGLVGMRFNRLLVYPTCLFHSRYPRELTGFGDTPTTGRLIWGCFFSPA